MVVPKPKETDPTVYHFIHDLRAINNIVEPMKAIVANLYTILNGISHKATHFTVVDLKDAFFSIPINKEIRDLFTFEWTDPEYKRTRKFQWMVLLQGFVHSPTIFAQVLGSHLQQIKAEDGAQILQYVGYLLVTGVSPEVCKRVTYSLLNSMGRWGYCASPGKFQFCKTEVRYLGHVLKEGEKKLASSRIQLIKELVLSRTKRSLRGYLGMTGFCCPWIPCYGEIAKPLYAMLTANTAEPLKWNAEQQKAFDSLKEALAKAPALDLLDYEKPFELYVNE